jgi:beta-glucosidase
VTNTGPRAGDEVVQLYMRDPVASVSRPVEQLRGFRRVALQPGETRTRPLHPHRRALRAVGPAGGWQIEPGTIELMVAGRRTRSQRERR